MAQTHQVQQVEMSSNPQDQQNTEVTTIAPNQTLEVNQNQSQSNKEANETKNVDDQQNKTNTMTGVLTPTQQSEVADTQHQTSMEPILNNDNPVTDTTQNRPVEPTGPQPMETQDDSGPSGPAPLPEEDSIMQQQ
ncbi:1416_t:CDS:1, partial [Dentiscutata erythropus]